MHGYLSCKESFTYQINFFSKYFKVVAVDMTGFGKSPPMRYPYSLDDYVNEIKGVIDEIGADSLHVVAHSFGARVLVKLLETDKRIDKIVLTGAAGLKPKRSVKYFFRKTAFKLLSKFIGKNGLRKFYSKDYAMLSPVMKESFKLVLSEDLNDNYRRIKNKTLIIFGKKDRETPLFMAKRMKRFIKKSQLVVLRKEGHFCFSENPLEFNAAVFSFLMGR